MKAVAEIKGMEHVESSHTQCEGSTDSETEPETDYETEAESDDEAKEDPSKTIPRVPFTGVDEYHEPEVHMVNVVTTLEERKHASRHASTSAPGGSTTRLDVPRLKVTRTF